MRSIDNPAIETAPSSRSQLRRALHDSPAARVFVRVVGAWALAAGRPVSVDALTVIALAKEAADEPVRLWTAAGVESFLWADAVTWCQAMGVTAPTDLAETLWSVFDHLSATDSFAPESDPAADLRMPLLTVGGLTREGRRPLPNSRRRRTA